MDSKPQEASQDQHLLGRIRAVTPAIVSNNAPRVVAGLKIAGSTFMLFSKNRFFSIAGAGFIFANSLTAIFAGKKSEEEKERLRQEEEAQNAKPKTGFASYFNKLLHPNKYPIESGASIFMMSSTLWTLSGLFGRGGFSAGRLIGGAFSLASDANVVFTKEKIGEPEANPHVKGTLRYYFTEMKNRPVLLSSLMNISCDITSVAGGAYERFRKGKEANTLFAGLFLLSANIFQAIFVNKNDYNIEQKSIIPALGQDEKIIGQHSGENEKKIPVSEIFSSVKKSSWCKRTEPSFDNQLARG